MLFDLAFRTQWKDIKEKRQKAAISNNKKENQKRKPHTYAVGDKILLDRGEIQRKLIPKREGPFQVVRVYDNGTLKIRKGIYTQRYEYLFDGVYLSTGTLKSTVEAK